MRYTQSGNVVLNGVVVDLDGESLRYADGVTTSLRPQTFAILGYLVSNPNRIVTRSELSSAIWGDRSVTDDSLVQCVLEIRRALRDEHRVVLQTVPRRGYRLLLTEAGPAIDRDRPFILVQPFANLSGDPRDDYFVRGLVDDVVTELSKIAGLFVAAHRMSGGNGQREATAVPGVRYVVTGSVRKSGDRLRINGQLVESQSGSVVWAAKFEGEAAKLFDFQDQLTEQISAAVEPSLRRAEIERSRRKRPDSLDSYDLYLQALPHAYANTPMETDEALRLLHRSLALDPNYLPAQAHAAWCHEQRYFRNGFDPSDRDAALRHADIVTAVNATDPQAMSIGAFVRAIMTRDYEAAAGVLDRALAMNPNSALALGFSALIAAHGENHERAVAHAERALRLSLVDDPLNYHPYCALTLTNLFAGEFEAAVRYGNLTIRANPAFSVPHAYLIAAYVELGRHQAARAAADRLLEIAPGFTVARFTNMKVFRPPLMERMALALRQAGLPVS
jgi:TolB-like protein/DNA-binding winged helix-turn-helix (wHTH) protein